jgi:WhiB family redox-sensing transcriptional regulator
MAAMDERTKWEREKEKNVAKAMQMPRIPCACGCGALILALTAAGKPAKYKNGHSSPAWLAKRAKEENLSAPLPPLALPRFSARPACVGEDPEIFFVNQNDPELHIRNDQAKRICGGCPVREQCLEWALSYGEHGTWGGLTAQQRGQLRHKRATERAA